MTPDFSEFSYGFAFTHEYINRNPGLRVAPELPSLINEAETGHCQERFFLVGVQGKSVHRNAVFQEPREAWRNVDRIFLLQFTQ